MKKLLLLFTFLFTTLVFSQQKNVAFEITKVGTKYKKDFIQKAFETANLCGNFYHSVENDIVLDDGSIVRLLSRKSLKDKIIMPDDCYVSDKTSFDNIKWSISDSGIIIRGYEVRPNKSTIK
jgi:hypothetical protein